MSLLRAAFILIATCPGGYGCIFGFRIEVASAGYGLARRVKGSARPSSLTLAEACCLGLDWIPRGRVAAGLDSA